MPPSTPSPFSRFLLPTLAVVVVFGVILAGAWFSRTGEKPVSNSQAASPALSPPAALAAAPPATVPVTVSAPPSAAMPALAKAAVPPSAQRASSVPASADSANSAPVTPAAPPAATRQALTDPMPAQRPFSPGEPASAWVTVGGVHTPLLSPNQVGAFPRVYLPQGGQADVQVQLPEAAAGDQVVVAVEDGGDLANGKPAEAFTLDESRQIAFQFQASQSLGNFRVSVRHGAQTKIVTFWAGDRTLALNH